jgi:hypothetical protein
MNSTPDPKTNEQTDPVCNMTVSSDAEFSYDYADNSIFSAVIIV